MQEASERGRKKYNIKFLIPTIKATRKYKAIASSQQLKAESIKSNLQAEAWES